MQNRKGIPAKIRLEVLKRDNFTCVSCGKSPALYPELEIDAVIKLEIDHVQPHSKGGENLLENLQTLCLLCNRGKGNDETLNLTVKNKLENKLNEVNPRILSELKTKNNLFVIANDSDYLEIIKLNNLINLYKITPTMDTIHGYHAGFNMYGGIYTILDNNAAKVCFNMQIQ
jgi:hypothetical protein